MTDSASDHQPTMSTGMDHPTPASSGAPLRADAQRNRDAILHAARLVIAEQGYRVPLHLIAKRAGVGRATMNRRFPTRESLIMASAQQNMARLRQLATQTADQPDSLLQMLTETATIVDRDKGFINFLYSPDVPPALREELARELVDIMSPALHQAQQAGLLRPDLDPVDIILIVDMLVGPLTHPLPSQADLNSRVTKVLALIHTAIGVEPRH
ncbi:MAG: TetR/AcrR family transcriptional regulator [Rhodococcus sp. (in: high G+C Gram-positive bacteria)]|uniref:TetR/AcrR family transcriptional regulator n=1 Tax=Rhodococcus sp. TaxID=1831 RepID=UPI003BB0E31E